MHGPLFLCRVYPLGSKKRPRQDRVKTVKVSGTAVNIFKTRVIFTASILYNRLLRQKLTQHNGENKQNHKHVLSSDLGVSLFSLLTLLFFFTKQRKQKWQVQELVAWSMEEASPEGSLGVQFQSVDKSRLELFWVSQALLLPSSLATEPEPLLHFLTLHTRIQRFHTNRWATKILILFYVQIGVFLFPSTICSYVNLLFSFILMKSSHLFMLISCSV